MSPSATSRLGRPLLVLAAASLLGCPGPHTGGTTDHPPIDNPPKLPKRTDIEMPQVPAVVDEQKIEPMASNDPAAASPVLEVMADENGRWMKALAGHDPAPAYYLAYAIHDQREVNIEAESGALIGDRDEQDRLIDVEIRVGTPELDNTHAPSKDPELNTRLERQAFAPSGDDAEAVASALWLETDRRYREAAMQLDYVHQDRMVAREKALAPDFAPSTKEVFVQPRVKLTFDKAHWVERMKACSKAAMKGVATRGGCSVTFTENTIYFVNSEGSRLQQSWTTAQLAVSVGVKADDGEGL
ncbi:MAG TPA: hypothetical protein VL172_21235, partial [Kofleriaceae bacterium]|nr:hypothetical protein [Kofleriaceae bacterium]